MKPSDALQQDWRLYYDQAWMNHRLFGPGMVRVIGNTLYFFRFPNDEMESEGTKVRGTDLQCWWPRSGSYNVPGGAVYLARRTTRSMRKSAHPSEHYSVKWGHTAYGNHSMMLQLRNGPAIVDVEFATKAIQSGMTESAAISNDIILASGPQHGLTVIFRGIAVGELDDGVFSALHQKAALSRRAALRLKEENII